MLDGQLKLGVFKGNISGSKRLGFCQESSVLNQTCCLQHYCSTTLSCWCVPATGARATSGPLGTKSTCSCPWLGRIWSEHIFRFFFWILVVCHVMAQELDYMFYGGHSEKLPQWSVFVTMQATQIVF